MNDLVQVFLKPLGRSSLELFLLCLSPPGCVSECPDPGNNGDDNHRSALAALPLEGIISCAEHPIQPNPAANPVVSREFSCCTVSETFVGASVHLVWFLSILV